MTRKEERRRNSRNTSHKAPPHKPPKLVTVCGEEPSSGNTAEGNRIVVIFGQRVAKCRNGHEITLRQRGSTGF